MSDVLNLGTLVVFLEANTAVFDKMLNAAEGHTKGSMDRMVNVAKVGATAIVGALVAIGTAAVHEFAQFDEAMTRSLSMMDGVNENTRKQLEDTARTVALTGRKSADELAKAYGNLEDAGFNAQQSMMALAVAEQFASTHAMDMAVSIKTLTGAQAALGLVSKDAVQNAKNLQAVADTITKASEVGKGSTEEYAAALVTSARVMKQFNISMADGMGVFAAFADANIRGAEAGDLFNTVLKNLQIGALKQEEIWKRFGIAVYDAQGQMRPLADILSEIDKATAGFSDEQKRATLELLGFNNRVITQIQAVMGASAAIKGYQQEMQNVAGTTAEAAEKQKSFHEQMNDITKAIHDAALEIGSALVPVLSFMFDWIQKNTDAVSLWREAVLFVADALKTGLILAVTGVLDILYHMQLAVLAGKTAWAALWFVIMSEGKLALNIFNGVVNGFVDGINKVISAYNFLAEKAHVATIGTVPKFTALDEAIKKMGASTDKAEKELEQTAGALVDLYEKGKPSIKFLADLEESEKKAAEAANKAASEQHKLMEEATKQKRIDASLLEFFGDLDKQVTKVVGNVSKITPELIEFENLTRSAFGTSLEQVKKYEKVLAQGAIDANQFADAVRQLVSASNEFVAPVKGLFEHTGDQGTDQLLDLMNQEKITQDHYARQQADFRKHMATMNKEDAAARAVLQEMQDEADQRYLERMKVFEEQRVQLLLGSASAAFDSLAGIQAQAFGKQSAAYKAAFAISKAFAIAEAAIQIQVGISKAVGLGWPLMIPAIASVVATAAGLISNIQAVAMSFEGGGSTGNGARVGGLDGKGGFMAMMHPQEVVTDLTKGGGGMAGGGDPIMVTVNQTYTGGVTEKDLANASAVNKRETIAAITDGIKRAGGFRASMHR